MDQENLSEAEVDIIDELDVEEPRHNGNNVELFIQALRGEGISVGLSERPLDRLLNENLNGLKKVMISLRNLGFDCDDTWRQLNQRRDDLERNENENGNNQLVALSEMDLSQVSQIVRSAIDDDRRGAIRRVEADFFAKRYMLTTNTGLNVRFLRTVIFDKDQNIEIFAAETQDGHTLLGSSRRNPGWKSTIFNVLRSETDYSKARTVRVQAYSRFRKYARRLEESCRRDYTNLLIRGTVVPWHFSSTVNSDREPIPCQVEKITLQPGDSLQNYEIFSLKIIGEEE